MDVVDRRDRFVRVAPRSEVRARRLLHRGIVVMVTNSAGAVYVHRRSDAKDIFPGMHSMFVGGMVAAGDGYDETARRELHEELGITGVRPTSVAKHLVQTPENPHWAAVYETTWDGPIRHQEGEVAWGAFMTPAEVVRRAEEWRFTPDALEIWNLFFAAP